MHQVIKFCSSQWQISALRIQPCPHFQQPQSPVQAVSQSFCSSGLRFVSSCTFSISLLCSSDVCFVSSCTFSISLLFSSDVRFVSSSTFSISLLFSSDARFVSSSTFSISLLFSSSLSVSDSCGGGRRYVSVGNGRRCSGGSC